MRNSRQFIRAGNCAFFKEFHRLAPNRRKRVNHDLLNGRPLERVTPLPPIREAPGSAPPGEQRGEQCMPVREQQKGKGAK